MLPSWSDGVGAPVNVPLTNGPPKFRHDHVIDFFFLGLLVVTESRFNYNYRWNVCVDCSNLLGQHGQHCVCAGPGLFRPKCTHTHSHHGCALEMPALQRQEPASHEFRCPIGAAEPDLGYSRLFLIAEPRCRPMRIYQTRILSLLPTWNSIRTCRCRRPMTLLLLSRDGSSILNHRSLLLRSDAFALVSRHSPWNNLRSRADIES